MERKQQLKLKERKLIDILKSLRIQEIDIWFMFIEIIKERKKLNYPCTAIFLYERFDKYAEKGFSYYCKLLKYINLSNKETNQILKDSTSSVSIGKHSTGLSINKLKVSLTKVENTEELNKILKRIESEKWSTHKLQMYKVEKEFKLSELSRKIRATEEIYDFINPVEIDIQMRGNLLTLIKQHQKKTGELINKFAGVFKI